MSGKAACVAFHSSKHCFANIPRTWTSKISRDKVSVFEVQGDGGALYTSWGGGTTSGDGGVDVIEINGLFGSKQKLQHDEEVLVSQLPSVPSCAQLFVEPLSITDWEILELHASYIEANLLQQVRAVWIGQVIPIWVQRGICIFVKIGNMVPSAKCCLLEENSEVYVAPKARNAVAKKSTEVTSSGQNKRDTNGAVGGNIKSQDDAIATEGLSIPMDKQRVRNMSGNKFVSDLKKAAESYNEKEGASSDDSREDASEKRGTVGQVYSYLKSLWSGQKGSDGTEEPSEPVVFYQSEILHEHFDCNLRVQSLDDIFDGCHDDVATETKMLLQQQTTVFISPSTFRKHCAHRTCNGLSTFFATVTKLPSPSEREEIQNRKSRPQPKSDASSESSLESHSPREVAVRVVVSSLLEGIPRDHVAISDVLRGQLGYPTTSRVRLTAATHDETNPRHVTLSPLFVSPSGYTPDMLLTAAATWCEEMASVTRPLVVSPGVIVRIPLNNDVRGYFLLSFPAPGPAARYCLVSPGGCPRLEIRDQITPSQLTDGLARFAYSGASSPCEDVDPPQTGLTAAQLGGVCDTLTALDRSLSAALGLAGPPTLLPRGPGSGSVLVCGPRGAGKSVVALAAVQSVARRPGGVYVSTVSCRGLRGKRIDSLRKLLLQLFLEASWRQPAVLLLDDLDHVTAAPSGPEQEMSGEATYYTRVAQVLSDLLDTETHARSRVVVIATARSRASLHPSLTSSHGKHYFSEIINITQPDKAARSAILRSQLLTKPCVAPACLDDLDLDLVSAQTEGFVARDLEMVVERAIHAHRIVNVNDSQELLISQSDLTVALRGFTPSALRHVSLHKAGELGWADVGGLAEVRRILVETLQWPAKYPALFASVPLRLRSGLLLYGAPGTGKTLLAGIVAKECGLNFISIKGPELLSKYIGASEQAVRDTFVRAQSAKPCILFFDEFDSLAPRRGHDSTGVTDRVVNQLLTQLDGVEGLQGVYVLGATSRPDLIDPALLRPGRLDKALHCPMPDQDERLEILSSLTRHMTLDPDVDLTYLAESCDHFTGADYKALLYNAQLEAIHEITGVKQGPQQLKQNIQPAQQEQSVQLTQPAQQELNTQTVNDATMGQKSAISSDLTNGNIDESIENDNLTNKDLNAMDENDRVNVGAKQKVVEKPRDLVTPSDLATPGDLPTPVDPATPCVAHIPSLEEGSVELTAEQQQEILSLYTQTAPPGEQREATRPAVVITQRHLVAAARDTRPSVTAAERRKYRKIYENFVASRGGNFSDQVPAGGKKATLA